MKSEAKLKQQRGRIRIGRTVERDLQDVSQNKKQVIIHWNQNSGDVSKGSLLRPAGEATEQPIPTLRGSGGRKHPLLWCTTPSSRVAGGSITQGCSQGFDDRGGKQVSDVRNEAARYMYVSC